MKIKDREEFYTKFKNKWVWKSIDFDRVYWPQCIDLWKQYALECYWVPLRSFWGSAYSGYENKSKTFNSQWKQIPHTAWNIPIVWDLIFWKPTKSNPYWHIAIAGIWSDTMNLVLLEQNYVAWNSPHFWKGTWPAKITERKRGYNWFAGSWRFMWA